MKKIIIFLTICFLLTSCGQDPISSIFKLKSVKNVQIYATDDEVEKLEKEAQKYEDIVGKKIETADKLSGVYESLGLRYIYRRNWDLAISSFEKSISYGNDKDQTFQKLGAAYANRGSLIDNREDLLKAETHYKQSLTINPTNIEARYGLSLLYYYKLNNKQEGQTILKKLVTDVKSFYPARFALARIYYEEQDYSASRAMYQELLHELNSEKKTPVVTEYKKKANENLNRLITETGN